MIGHAIFNQIKEKEGWEEKANIPCVYLDIRFDSM